ncbi:hypothetical protein [Hymenobacter sp. DG01]|uniref:hypothetical protein n=1 Tax=Hymenobacter sp. DG01 TaxID=2584940 RepID=UPI001C5D45D3|nr:hypothetical protein [Hymenobacter sp. DG01]
MLQGIVSTLFGGIIWDALALPLSLNLEGPTFKQLRKLGRTLLIEVKGPSLPASKHQLTEGEAKFKIE